jgi:hypothetical protein
MRGRPVPARGANSDQLVTVTMLFDSSEIRYTVLKSGMERGAAASYDRLAAIRAGKEKLAWRRINAGQESTCFHIWAYALTNMAASDPKEERLVTVRQFRDLPEALLAKSILDAAGIECLLGDENMVRMDWFISNALGGVKVWVRREDADAAAKLLDQSHAEAFSVDGVGEYKQPRCPKCQSFDVSFEELNKSVAYSSAFFGVPLPLKRHGWRCHSCGHAWEEPNDTSQQTP